MTEHSFESGHKILIVDSHPLVREGLLNSFAHDSQFEVVAEASDGAAAMIAAQRHQHDILLIGAFLPGANVFEVVRNYKKSVRDVKVAICYAPEDSMYLQEFVESGADALVGQDANSSEYIAAALSIITGGFFISANLVHCLLLDRKVAQERINNYHLTPRETEVLRMLARGLCNKEIAGMLEISVRTVEAHRFSIRNKTNANSLSELVRIGWGLGAWAGNGSGTANSISPTSENREMSEYAKIRASGGR